MTQRHAMGREAHLQCAEQGAGRVFHKMREPVIGHGLAPVFQDRFGVALLAPAHRAAPRI